MVGKILFAAVTVSGLVVAGDKELRNARAVLPQANQIAVAGGNEAAILEAMKGVFEVNVDSVVIAEAGENEVKIRGCLRAPSRDVKEYLAKAERDTLAGIANEEADERTSGERARMPENQRRDRDVLIRKRKEQVLDLAKQRKEIAEAAPIEISMPNPGSRELEQLAKIKRVRLVVEFTGAKPFGNPVASWKRDEWDELSRASGGKICPICIELLTAKVVPSAPAASQPAP